MTAAMVVIGAGQSGLQVAESLRSEGWGGDVVMIGDEAAPPYHRPPLSKAYLLGESSDAQLTIRGPEALAKKNIRLISGVSVTAIDRAAKTVSLSDGRSLAYSGLALATGSRPRPLPVPGADLGGVFPLRTLDDCRAIEKALASATNVVVIGGGFIGLEFAAVARKKGKNVVVLETAERLMARVVAPIISTFYADLHARHGVSILLGAQVTELRGENGQVHLVHTASGVAYPADLVIAGIGVIPNTELAATAGLEVESGIVVDACSRTADPAIVACGDCAAVRLADRGLRRLESVQNAIEQGKSAAAALMGKEKPFVAAPWFWSDQYDIKLQMVGQSAGHDRFVIRGNPVDAKFSVFYYRDGKLIGIDSLNRSQDHMAGRKLLEKGASPDPDRIADEAYVLTEALPQ